ncbi:MAG TPA: hypothetical protein VKQ29_07920 [Aliidongia sp.]|nr:hypothetical protein [Aliidongia sp.]
MSPHATGRLAAAAALLLMAVGLAGCGVKSRPIPPSEGELGNSPGLLSGPAGEFTVYQK